MKLNKSLWSLTIRLRNKIWPSPQRSPRIQSVDEEMFSAKEEQESSDDLVQGSQI